MAQGVGVIVAVAADVAIAPLDPLFDSSMALA